MERQQLSIWDENCCWGFFLEHRVYLFLNTSLFLGKIHGMSSELKHITNLSFQQNKLLFVVVRKSVRSVHILALHGSHFAPEETKHNRNSVLSNKSKALKTDKLEQKVDANRILCNNT